MKILVVFTGGTIGSSDCDGVVSPDIANSYKLLKMYSKIDDSVKFVSAQPYNILSENVCSDNFTMLCDCIKSFDLSNFDGVVVTHGTDTLQYTSAYLSYVFGFCKTPIVVVSANYPLSDTRSNGFANFCAAVDFVRTGQGRGVFVAYKNGNSKSVNIHRASRILPHSPYSDEVYSIYNINYGEVFENKFIKNKNYTESENKTDFSKNYKINSNSRVLYMKSYVGISYPEITQDIKAVLLEGYHSGTLNTSGKALSEFCRKAHQKGVPVFLTGACDGFNYESKKVFEDLKIKVLPPASPIAIYVKLMLLAKENIDDVNLPCGGDFAQ